MISAARNCYYAAEYTANPTLLEPIFLAEITVPMDATGGVY